MNYLLIALALLPVAYLLYCMIRNGRRGPISGTHDRPIRLRGRHGLGKASEISEQRRSGRQRGGRVTLILTRGDYEGFGGMRDPFIRDLVEHGPQSNVWLEVKE